MIQFVRTIGLPQDLMYVLGNGLAGDCADASC
jgi:hypothetical protein